MFLLTEFPSSITPICLSTAIELAKLSLKKEFGWVALICPILNTIFLSLFTQMRFKIIFPFDSPISYQFFIICANMNHNEKRQKQFFVLVPQEIL